MMGSARRAGRLSTSCPTDPEPMRDVCASPPTPQSSLPGLSRMSSGMPIYRCHAAWLPGGWRPTVAPTPITGPSARELAEPFGCDPARVPRIQGGDHRVQSLSMRLQLRPAPAAIACLFVDQRLQFGLLQPVAAPLPMVESARATTAPSASSGKASRRNRGRTSWATAALERVAA
jgi:hypothetical protein